MKHGLSASALISFINRNCQGKRIEFGKIEILRNFSFFEVDQTRAGHLLEDMDNAQFDGFPVKLNFPFLQKMLRMLSGSQAPAVMLSGVEAREVMLSGVEARLSSSGVEARAVMLSGVEARDRSSHAERSRSKGTQRSQHGQKIREISSLASRLRTSRVEVLIRKIIYGFQQGIINILDNRVKPVVIQEISCNIGI